ncbi:Hypothetical predicted protein [Octopus vulgaris]|uniref:Uncharacterized protein n=2 Tax=Octopus TaxID=6643 RepID=A0AA36FAQ7_OCTVU|nr:uncharacterized protein LOC115217445 [Octopus sinensis]XP_036363270.1 uncharacterized protein LOC115217445 [Octopus sinensis]XP_036363271.1 uncharacterized protein LOC115217445 [Octopus sinensis]XP_036363272.1 uncharacterized protein LOC115217445 [Octopus sinensis]CAI9730429.1 Hypothetical predicted protein [Octopus vulgaris]
MEGNVVFLLVCSIFSGIIFAVGCIASVIKAVRDRRQILRRRNERNQVGMGDVECVDNLSEEIKKDLTSSGVSDKNSSEPTINSDAAAKSLRSADTLQSPASEKIELVKCMKGSFAKNSPDELPGNAIQLSVIDRKYAVYSKPENGYINRQRLDNHMTENGSNPHSIPVGNTWKTISGNNIVHKNRHSTSGTLLVKTHPTFLRTKSYQSAMKTNIYAEVPSPSKSDFEFSSSESIIKCYQCNERRPGLENNAYNDEDSQLRYL